MQHADQPTDADLLQAFESLGGTGHGAEFGLFLNSIGAGEAGLLHEAEMGADLLSKALEARLAGVGAPENTIVFRPNESEHWWTKDKRYLLAMRSPLRIVDATEAEAIAHLCARQQQLRDALIADLTQGGRIFVYRNALRDLTDAELARLHAALRAIGDTTLLYVRYADDSIPAGSVVQPEPGLLVGALERFMVSPRQEMLGSVHEAWRDLCIKAWRLQRGLSEPTAAAPVAEDAPRQSDGTPTLGAPHHATPVVRTARQRRIVAVGNGQVVAMASLFERFSARRTGDRIDVIASNQELSAASRDLIRQADIVVEQVMDVAPKATLTEVPPSAQRLTIPLVSAAFLWPFAGQAHPKHFVPPFMTGGPYGGEAGDFILNRHITAGTNPEQAAEAYMAMDARARIDLDRLFELVLHRQRARDAVAGYRIAEVIEQRFRDEQIFLTPSRPNRRIALTLAQQFFEQLGASHDDVDRMWKYTGATPFPPDELPIHPSVARHFRLSWAPPERRYRFMNEGAFTTREHALRYMRFAWNEPLEEALSLLRAGPLEAAEPKLHAALQISPNSAAAHAALAQIYAERAPDRAKAHASIRQALALEPDSAPYLALLGRLLQQDGAADKAERVLRAALAAAPEDSAHYQRLALLLRDQRRHGEACALLDRAIEIEPYDAALHAHLAEAQAAAERPAEAADQLARASQLEPDNPAWPQQLATLARQLEQPDAAIGTARAALARAAGDVASQVRLSQTLAEAGQIGAALAQAYTAAVSEPPNAAAYAQLGVVLRQNNALAAAERAFSRAIQLAPSDAHYLHELSVLYAWQERFAAAARVAIVSAAREPENPHRLVHLAAIMSSAGDHEGAVMTLEKAIALAPDDVSIRIAHNKALLVLGRIDDALAAFTAIASAHPDAASVIEHLDFLQARTRILATAEDAAR